ncbi:MAG: hypothetical protein HYY67_06220 [Thaumarchaeota archaeon]|nr:hypothetical protein [Nitrososphaerota archaeon]
MITSILLSAIGSGLLIAGIVSSKRGFWEWLNKYDRFVKRFPRAWYFWANNHLNKYSITLILIGSGLQLTGTLLG